MGGCGRFGLTRYAILLSELTGLQGTKVQIASAMEIKQHIDRAMELEDKDPMPPYMAGAWAFEFSNLSTVSRWFAQKLFGKLPETSFKDALGYFELSEVGVESVQWSSGRF